MTRSHTFMLIPVLLLVAACGGEADPELATTPSFATVYEQVIKKSCSCHLGATGSGGLAMADAPTAYAALVGQSATAGGPCEGGVRVVEGDAAGSVLYRKVSGEDLCGAQMPMGGAQLSSADRALLEAWIEGGAPEE
jgi:hypothetical protein